MGPGAGHGGDGAGPGGDMMGIHFLFAHRDEIRRTVVQIPGGVRTTTEADDPAVVTQLQEHVRAMYARLEEGRPINTHDPLFAALFKNADKIDVADRTHRARVDGHRDLERRERDQADSAARRGGRPVHRQRHARNDAEPFAPRRTTHVPARDLQGLRQTFVSWLRSPRRAGARGRTACAIGARAARGGEGGTCDSCGLGLVDWMADLFKSRKDGRP